MKSYLLNLFDALVFYEHLMKSKKHKPLNNLNTKISIKIFSLSFIFDDFFFSAVFFSN